MKFNISYKDFTPSYESVAQTDGSMRIHLHKLQKLTIDIFKFKQGLSPPVMNEIFDIVVYNFCQECLFNALKVKHVFNGTETIRYRVPEICGMIPVNIK